MLKVRPTLIVDGLNVFYRHFVANPSMNRNGEAVGGIVGFVKGLQLLCERYNPEKVVIVWEGGGSPRRRSIDPTYKGGRRPEKLNRFYAGDIPDTVSNRNNQVSQLVSLLRCTSLPQLYISDCEADDIIAYLTKSVYTNNLCVIISTDKDFYQLIDDKTLVWSPGSKKEWNSETVVKKYNIHPENFCLARCFVGDMSDGLKGVPGAGFKSLAKRFPSLAKHETLTIDSILTECGKLQEQKSLKLYDSIMNNESIIRKNWKLMYLGQGNLSGTQIQKIHGALELDRVPKNKLQFIRALIELDIKNVDYDKFFMTLKALS